MFSIIHFVIFKIKNRIRFDKNNKYIMHIDNAADVI